MIEKPKPYQSGDLIQLGIKVPIIVDPARVLATYADPGNWKRVTAEQRNWWAWTGPTIVGYELAENAFEFGPDQKARDE